MWWLETQDNMPCLADWEFFAGKTYNGWTRFFTKYLVGGCFVISIAQVIKKQENILLSSTLWLDIRKL